MGEIKHGGGSVPLGKRIPGRVKHGEFTYPYGAYPANEFPQQTGYDSKYLKEEGCFYYQVVVPHERLWQSLSTVLNLLPEKARLAIKIHSGDYYRDYDTYISADFLDRNETTDWMKEWINVVLDDGFFGIGMFAETKTVEVFLDEHKTIHVYHHDPDLMEGLLEQMGIPFIMNLKFFWDEPHYHEPLLLDEHSNDDDYLTAFEDLADQYDLFLDDDDSVNNDDEGHPLGVTCWRVEVRGYGPGLNDNLDTAAGATTKGFYTTLYANAESRNEVIELVDEYYGLRDEVVDIYLQVARIPAELLTSDIAVQNVEPESPCVWHEAGRAFFE